MSFLLGKVSPEWSLRIGLALMYFYSGYDLLTHPTAWTWALPLWLKQIISSVLPVVTYLRIQGVVEIVLAILLLAWFLPARHLRWVALLSAAEMAGILAISGNFATTFRDIGLLGASLALLLILVGRDADQNRSGMIQ